MIIVCPSLWLVRILRDWGEGQTIFLTHKTHKFMKPNVFSEPWEEVINTLQESANLILLLHKLIRLSQLPKYSKERLIDDWVYGQSWIRDDLWLLDNTNKLISYIDDILVFYTDGGNEFVDRDSFERLSIEKENNKKYTDAGQFFAWHCMPKAELSDEDYEIIRTHFIDNGEIVPPIASDMLRLMKYDEFLKTNYWRSISRYVREERGECELCGAKVKLHVHHKTYEHHGFEHQHLEDLQCLCHECHLKVHHELNKKK